MNSSSMRKTAHPLFCPRTDYFSVADGDDGDGGALARHVADDDGGDDGLTTAADVTGDARMGDTLFFPEILAD